jgi:hemolysin activation/secretion protein
MKLYTHYIKRKIQKYVLAALSILMACSSVVFSQGVDIPEGSTADREQERLFEQKPPEDRVPETPDIELETRIPGPGELGADADISFKIDKIIVEGSTIFSEEELREIVSPYENTVVSLRKLYSLAEEITEMYHDFGYITSRAYVPPQEIKDGVVIIKIFEGEVGAIKIEGNKYFRTSFIEKRLKTLQGKILQQDELRDILIQLNKIEDLSVRVVLERGEQPKTTDLIVAVEDNFPYHAGYIINNQGGRLTERLRHIFFLSSSNTFGYGDSLSLTVPWADTGAVRGFAINYEVPVNETGTSLGVGISSTRVTIGKEFSALNIIAASDSYSTYVNHPFFRSRTFEVNGKIGFEGINSSTKVLAEELFLTELRVLNLELALNGSDAWGRSSMSGGVDFGFPNILGASAEVDDMASPSDTGGRLTRFDYSATRLQLLPFIQSYMIMSVSGQLARHQLPGAKRYSTGGAYSVRGYPEGDAGGDYGINGTCEINSPFFLLPDGMMYKESKIKNLIRLAAFYDIGMAKNKGTDDKRIIAGTGFGFRYSFDGFSGRVDFGWPIGDGPTEEIEYKIHFSSTLRY